VAAAAPAMRARVRSCRLSAALTEVSTARSGVSAQHFEVPVLGSRMLIPASSSDESHIASVRRASPQIDRPAWTKTVLQELKPARVLQRAPFQWLPQSNPISSFMRTGRTPRARLAPVAASAAGRECATAAGIVSTVAAERPDSCLAAAQCSRRSALSYPGSSSGQAASPVSRRWAPKEARPRHG